MISRSSHFLTFTTILSFIGATVCTGGDLRIADSVSWSSLIKYREKHARCEGEFDLIKDNKKWDFCYDVPTDKFGGDYRMDEIKSPNEVRELVSITLYDICLLVFNQMTK